MFFVIFFVIQKPLINLLVHRDYLETLIGAGWLRSKFVLLLHKKLKTIYRYLFPKSLIESFIALSLKILFNALNAGYYISGFDVYCQN